jgi:adenosine deaminase
VNQILCCICWRPDWADSVVELAFERKNKGPCAIVGVDIAAGEEHFDSEKFPQFHLKHFEAMQKAQKLGLNITLHAGEVGSSDNIDAAVALYGAKRIGHGYHVVKNPKLMEELKAKRIHLETCPTSSRETGGWEFAGAVDWTHHPCVEMIENGLSVSFNSDDPAVFNTSLSWQYRTVVAKMNQQRETLISGVLAAIDAAFCSDKQKRYLRSLIEDYETGEAVTVGNVEFNDRVIDNMLLLAGESM